MKRRFVGVMVLLCLSSLGCNREDYSTPKKAARTFYVAVARGDLATARRGLSDSAQAPLLDDVAALVKEILAARDAAEQKFGKDGQNVSGGLPELEELDGAKEAVSGDSATVTPSAAEKLAFKLKRVHGEWKVDLLCSFEMESATIEKAREIVKSAREAVAANAQRIREGRFTSAREADNAIQSSIRSPLALAQWMQRLGGGLPVRPKSQ